MTEQPDLNKKHSEAELEKIRKWAREIWQKKCDSFNAALDAWLKAELNLKAKTSQGAGQETATAKTVRDEKVKFLRAAFEEWLKAEHELKAELEKKIDLKDLFERWLHKASSHVDSLAETNFEVPFHTFNNELEQQYVELMLECMS